MSLKYYFAIIFVFVASNSYALPTAKITLKVIDETGKPVEGAKVGIGFRSPESTGWGSKSNRVEGNCDADGLFTGSSSTEPYITYSARKEGYYDTGGKFEKFSEATGFIGLRKWQPWNPTVELVLKEIKNPIPLYAVKAGTFEKPLEIPILNKFIGYDLVARDWVIPYGQGTHKDFLFKLEIHHVKSDIEFDAVLTLKFENPLDGIQEILADPKKGSVLRLPHHAPVNGYHSELVQKYKRDDKKMYSYPFRDDQNYFYRIRTEADDKGNIISALYGKIHGSVDFSGVGYREIKTSQLNFVYYLNPNSNDTNLEFDPEKNLFKDLTQFEEVKRP